MIFSKSFGYAVRGMLYVALMKDEKRFVQVEEIASALAVPRYFMGKILKRLVKERLLDSAKGPSGGFAANDQTLKVPLIRLIDITEGTDLFRSCVLRLKECNADNPCPMHVQVEEVRNKMKRVLSQTIIADLLKDNKEALIKSIATGGAEIFQSMTGQQQNEE